MITTSKHGLLPDASDLEAYFRRIGYAGPRTATFDTLAALHRLHPQAIPFENLDPLLRRPIVLSAAAFGRKMLTGGRGGWCYEHNLLFASVLEALGFRVTGYAARVLWGAPEGVVRPRTHMLLGVECPDGAARAGPGVGGGSLDNPGICIADVGFGGLTLTGPLRRVADIEQATPHETFRLVASGPDGYVLEVHLGGEWKPIYSFDPQSQVLADYELTNWYLGNFPESPFLQSLRAARAMPDRRYALYNNRLTTHYVNGAGSDQVMLTSPRELRGALGDVMRIVLPDDPGLEGVLERFAAM